jgi:hypothetical protein
MKKCGSRQQHFKNAAQLHQIKLDRFYKNASHRLMSEDWERQNIPNEEHDRMAVEYIGENNGRARYRVKAGYNIPGPVSEEGG